MASLARWCYRHRIVVVVVWLAVLLSVAGIERSVGSAYSNSFTLPGTESTRALDLLTSALPKQAGDSDTIVWHVRSGSVTDPAVRVHVQAFLQKVARSASVAAVRGPYSPTGAAQISKDGKTAYATVGFTKLAQSLPKQDVSHVINLVAAARTSSLQVEIGGQAIEQANMASLSYSVGIGIAAAAIIIVLAFGSLLGMALPLITAVVALGTATFAIDLFSHLASVAVIAPTLAALVGLGVGIDYALFIITRHRDGLKAGLSPEEAAVRALNTAGRAMLFAGSAVCIALLGLLILRLSYLTGMAFAAAGTVALTVATAATLLPALLGFMGMRVLSRSERRRLAESGPQDGHTTGFWARWARLVSRRRGILALAAVLVMATLASPVLSLRLGLSDAGNDPAASTTRKAYDLLAAGFGPGSNGPLLLVAQVGSAADSAALGRLAKTLQTVPGVAAVAPFPSKPGAKVAVVQVIPTTAPQDASTSDLIKHLRKDVIPAAEKGSGLRVLVGGSTAIFGDFAAIITAKLPLFIGVIVGLGFLGFGRARAGPRRARGGVPAGAYARPAVRALNGLPGVPCEPHARGVGAHARQQALGHPWAIDNRTRDHGRGGHHDLRVRGLRLRRPADHRRVRHRSGRRGLPGRLRAAHGARALADAPLRQGELVAPAGYRPAHAASLGGADLRRGGGGMTGRGDSPDGL